MYFLLFIDDYSRKTRVYFLKKSLMCLIFLKKFKVLIEKKSGYFIKSLKIGRGWILF